MGIACFRVLRWGDRGSKELQNSSYMLVVYLLSGVIAPRLEAFRSIYERPSKPTSTNLVKRGHKASLTSRIYLGTIGPPPQNDNRG